jgi:phosphoglycerol transferase
MTRFDKLRPALATLGLYLATGALSVAALVWALELHRADLRVPLYYTMRGDNFEHAMWLKTVVDFGSHLDNPLLGAPGALNLRDYPLSDTLHFGTVWLLARLTPSYGLVVNLFYLVGYPLAAWTSLFALRRLGLSSSVAVVVSLLYAFLPYHFLRGQCHILLSGYYAVPLMALVTIWIARGEPLFFASDDPDKTRNRMKAIVTLVTCVAIPATSTYYAFFGAFFVAVACGLSLARRWSFKRGLESALVTILMFGSLAVQLSPTLVHFARHGKTAEIARRTPHEAELYGLKIKRLLLPTVGHRLGLFQKLNTHGVLSKHDYAKISMTEINENETSALGLVGVAGFLFLLVALFVPRIAGPPAGLVFTLSRLNVAAILLATVGGFSSGIAALISPQIRAYNRISVYIAFYSLIAVGLGLEALRRRLADRPRARFLFVPAVGALLALGLWDQCPLAMVPDYVAESRAFEADQQFVQRIESTLGDHAMVFQLPYVPFPETPPVAPMHDYDHFWGYFHSTKLRWSYGAMKTRPVDEWQRRVASLPTPELVAELSAAGFRGITVDGNGYADGGERIRSELENATRCAPQSGGAGRVAFFTINPTDKTELARRKSATYGRIDEVPLAESAPGSSF